MKNHAIAQIDPDTGFVLQVYPSLHLAAKIVGCSASVISYAITGKQQTAAGYRWEKLEHQPPCSELCYDVLEYIKDCAPEAVSKAEVRFIFSLSKGSEQNITDKLFELNFIQPGPKGKMVTTEAGLKALDERPF